MNDQPVESSNQPAFSAKNKEVKIYTTAENTDLRLTLTGTKVFEKGKQPLETEIFVVVNPSKTFQTFLGIGGALTDASAEVFATLPQDKQEELLTAYYEPEKGIGYTFARTNIHSCDFSSASYTYVSDEDKELKSFSIDHDRKYRIPLIKRAMAASGGNLKIFASPWSPPAFMKTNNDMLHGGKLLPEYASSWSLYFTKFIKAYEAEGIPIWGITVQNEPMATQTWESCIYTAEEERDFLKNHLGPAMERAGLDDKKIIVWDHNRDLIVHRANTILGDPAAAKYVWGIGFHWYETWTGGQPMFDNVILVHESWPEKHLVFTEGTPASYSRENMMDWKNAERYGRSMIHDFNTGTEAWTDWNILLDMQGGPNHVGNFCVAPVHADTATGKLVYTPSYFYIGHFSKFIRPGARRVSCAPSRSALEATSFLNGDGTLATVVMNRTGREIRFNLIIGDQQVPGTIPARALQTYVAR
ncbi:MAG: glycoside hydrolase family 30 protein [Chlorobi bacterium]|nr:glycoside hydrolase family 30 protein [Chlorobiota bacterium]